MMLPMEGFSYGARIKLSTMDPFAGFGLPTIFLCWRTGTLKEFTPRGPSAGARLCKAFPVKEVCCCLDFPEAWRSRPLCVLKVRQESCRFIGPPLPDDFQRIRPGRPIGCW